MFFAAHKKKVLVIDDDNSLQRQLRFRLELHEKVTVEQALVGEDGVDLAVDGNPDLIILDWMLPDILGPEILKRLKKYANTAGIPVLMLTGCNKVGEIEEAFELGVNDYLTKPFTLEKLGGKVRMLLSGS
ncbi:MAG: response regulator [Gammaproteobacteria bacterium]|nr:response regulator [Gammaproteobacteria bacterium]